MTQTFDDTEHGRLLAELKVVPRPINSEAEHKAFLEIASGLMKKEPLSAEETTLLSHLAILISSYERERYAGLSSERKISVSQAWIFGERFKVNPSLFLYGVPSTAKGGTAGKVLVK
jgi:hypothetical protein